MTMHFPSVAELCPDLSGLDLVPDLQGWNSTDPVFAKLIIEVNPKVIVEVGSWKGMSALHMASLSKAEIYCVDTWLGGVDHFVNQDRPENDLRRDTWGYPKLYHQFIYNVATSLHSARIHPIAQTSLNGARLLGRAGIKADLINIDASHVYQDVYADLEHYAALLSDTGLMFGDDWNFPGVRLAVTRFAYETGLLVTQENKGWQLRRPA